MNTLTRLLATTGRRSGGGAQDWPADHLHRWCGYVGVLDAELGWRPPHTAQNPPNAMDLFNATKQQLGEEFVTDQQVAERLWECVSEMRDNGLPPFHPRLRRTARGRPWVGPKAPRWLQARKHSWAKGEAAKQQPCEHLACAAHAC